MSHSNDQRGNREVFTEWINTHQGGQRAIAEAELYLLTGKIVRQRVRRGYSPQVIADALGMTVVEALCALYYVESSPALILRALVGDWPWRTIKQHLSQQSDADRIAVCGR